MTHHALHLVVAIQTEGTRLLLAVVVHLLADEALIRERLTTQEAHKVILAMSHETETPTM